MAHTVPYNREKEKKEGPRHIDMSWAVCKFFFIFLLYNNLLAVFFIQRLMEMVHTSPYNREKG